MSKEKLISDFSDVYTAFEQNACLIDSNPENFNFETIFCYLKNPDYLVIRSNLTGKGSMNLESQVNTFLICLIDSIDNKIFNSYNLKLNNKEKYKDLNYKYKLEKYYTYNLIIIDITIDSIYNIYSKFYDNILFL